jgi:hypothetical protein
LVAVLVAVAAVLAACGGSTKKAAAPPATTAGATAATAATATPAPASTAAPALTASFRGVTATSIKIGVVNINYDCIKQFVDYNFGDQQAIDQTFIDDLNAHGGVLGRKIVPVYRSYCPIGNSGALQVCTSFTEDDKVFAVFGLLYDNTGDADLCLTRDHQTIYLGWELRQPWVDQSPPALMLTRDITAERRATVLLNLVRSQGTLKGKKVATFTDSDTASQVSAVVKPGLDAMGLAQGSPAVVTIVGSDTSAAQSQLDSFIEKWKAEGVTAIWMAGNFVTDKQFVEKIKSRMPDVLLVTDGEASAQGAGQDETLSKRKPNPYDGMITANGWTDDEVWAAPSYQQCVKTYEAGSGKQVIGPADLKPDAAGKLVQVWEQVRDFCGDLGLFTQIAGKAGPDLTNDTWSQAASAYGEIKVPDTPYASVHAGKFDANDGFRLVVFDSTIGAKGDFKALTPVLDASK